MDKSTPPANEITPDIQSHLQQLEILAHHANLLMDDMLVLVERQFVVAALKRRGNIQRAAIDLGKRPATVYRAMVRLRLAGRKGVA